MREIIFRGKCVDNGEWIYGSFIPDLMEVYYLDKDLDGFIKPFGKTKEERVMVEVERNTVGQYTGLTDKNGLTKIFEYDIIDANGRKVGNYYENSNLLKDGTCFLVAKMGTKEWSRSEQEAIKRGCKYAE